MKVTYRDTSATQYDANADWIKLKGNESLGKLYLGDRYSGTFLQLKHRECRVVVNCCKEIHSLSREEDVTYLNIDPANESTEELEKAYDFIENAINKGKNITVLCQSGSGKSAAVVSYYIMRKYLMNPFDAIEYIKTYHTKIRINPTIHSFICREAKKLGLMITSNDASKKSVYGWSRSGLYFILFGSLFFGLVYFGLVFLTSKPSPSSYAAKSSTRNREQHQMPKSKSKPSKPSTTTRRKKT